MITIFLYFNFYEYIYKMNGDSFFELVRFVPRECRIPSQLYAQFKISPLYTKVYHEEQRLYLL